MIALYPGAYKPPHRGHFNVVKSLLDNSYNGSVYNKDNYKETGAELLKGRSNKKPKIDKVLVFVGAGERNGITKEESMSIWNIYSKYLGNVEILDGGSNPMFAAKDYAQANPELEFVSVTGIRGDKDFVDLRRVTTFKNAPNVSGLALAAEPGSGIRATDFRNTILSGNLDKVLDFFPQDLSREEISAVLADLKDKIVSEILADNIEGYINNYFNKEDTINEIGDLSQEPYKWSAFDKAKDSSDPYSFYDFSTDNGTKYQVVFNREVFGKTVNYDMSFVAKGKDGKGFSTDALTGDNEPFKIMSTIVDITREQIKKAGDVEFITFEPTKGKTGEEGAKGNTRSKLYKIIIKKNFPKANVSGTDTVVVDMTAYLNKDLEEATEGNKIKCDNCTWSWEKKDAGGDAYTCHKCGHTNKTQALENFKDGKKKGKSRPGRVKKAGASCNGTKAELRAKAKKYGGEKGKMYHWCANMKEDTNETVMAEGKYDKLANKLSGLALETFLDIHDRGDKGGEFEFRVGNPEDPEVDIPSLQFEFDFLGVVEFTEDTYSVDGGANAGFDKEGDEIQPMLNVKFKIQKNPDWQEVSFDLKDVVRHELEHLTQDGENVKPGKYIEDDALVRGMIDMGVMDKDEYYKLPKEVDAMIQGMYFKAKKSRTPFTDVVEDYFEKAGVELENRKKIRILWNKRLPKLGIKQRL